MGLPVSPCHTGERKFRYTREDSDEGERLGRRAWEDWKRLLANVALPAAIVDLDALESNARAMTALLPERALSLRVASKSVRHVGMLKRILALDERFRGLMVYSPQEAEFLAERGLDDFLVAYPVADFAFAQALGRLATKGATVRQVIDSEDQVKYLASVGIPISVCIDVDASLRWAGTHLGVRRSPIRSAEHARQVASVARNAGLIVDSVMAYEAQVAGIPDVGGGALKDAAIACLKGRSIPQVETLRRQVVEALRADGHPVSLVNGGGTGSLKSSGGDPTLTEVTAGSGYYTSHLFDGYRDVRLEPASFFALRVVRKSDPDFATAYGGGIIASGSTGADRSPKVAEPQGIEPVTLEGWGEVQTAFQLGKVKVEVGDPIVCRPAKAGEWLERFAEVILIRGNEIVGREPTYRGEGQCF